MVTSTAGMQANLFIGLGILSTAYALKWGGWTALLGLLVNACCFAAAGNKSLLQAVPEKQDPATTYHAANAAHLSNVSVRSCNCSSMLLHTVLHMQHIDTKQLYATAPAHICTLMHPLL